MKDIPGWVLQVADARLRKDFGLDTVVHGSGYARRNRVESISMATTGTCAAPSAGCGCGRSTRACGKASPTWRWWPSKRAMVSRRRGLLSLDSRPDDEVPSGLRPDLRVATIAGTEVRRGILAEAVQGAHIVLTSYTPLRLETDDYRALGWSAVLLDEAQFVKNRTSKAHQAVRRLNARFTVALTGAPLENLMDLRSLLALTAPGLFRDPKAFTEDYRRPIEQGDDETLARLRRRVRPLMLADASYAAYAAKIDPSSTCWAR